MEQRYEEELRKLKADHDQLDARVRRPKGDEHSTYTLPKCTQGDSQSTLKMIQVSPTSTILQGGLLVDTLSLTAS